MYPMRPGVLSDQATDAEAIRRSLEEPDRFAVLFDRHYGRIFGYVGRRLQADVADDVASEVFLIAFRKRRDYDLDRADAAPWLLGIATNEIRRHHRAEARFYQSLARTGLELVNDGDAERADARITAQAARRRLAAALAGLSAKDRDVLTLVAFAELSQDDVAQVLAIPPGTVKSRLHRARGQLRAALGDLDPALTQEDSAHE